MKRIISIILCLCLLLPILSGCEMSVTLKDGVPMKGQTGQTGQTVNGGNNDVTSGKDISGTLDTGDLNIDTGEYAEYWANYDWENFDPADLIESLGDAAFTLDNNATATGEFTPGKPLSLSVTDSVGATWTLDVPPNALLYRETITMTAMRDITLSNYGALDSGVQLSPDGLTFFMPAVLTVSGGGFDDKTAMLTGEHDGSDAESLFCTSENGFVRADIYHFSTNMIADDSSLSSSASKKAFNAGSSYLDSVKNGVEILEPPSISFECDPDDHSVSKGYDILNEYCKQFFKPEIDIIKALNSSWCAKLGSAPKNYLFTQADYYYLNMFYEMHNKIYEKCIKVLTDYAYAEDKWKAVAHVTMWGEAMIISHIERLNNSLPPTVPGEAKRNIDTSQLFRLRTAWAEEVWNFWMEQLVEEHNYKAAHSLEWIYEYNKVVGVYVPVNFETLMGNALTFEVKHTIDFNGDGTYFHKTSGAATVRMDQISESEVSRFGSKAGTGKTDSATTIAPLAFDGPFSYDQTVGLSKLDPCFNKTITAGFSVFGAETENWYCTEPEIYGYPAPTIPGMVYVAFYSHAQDCIDKDADSPTYSGFKFELPLQNMSATAADKTFFWSGAAVFSLDVILTHTPEGEVYIK